MYLFFFFLDMCGSAMAQAVSRGSLTTETQGRARVGSCGICDGQSGTATGFPPSSSVLLCQYHSIVTSYPYVTCRSEEAVVQRRHTIDINTIFNMYVVNCFEHILQFN
jgi:hypothetical protein